MIILLDSSILVAALVESEEHHVACSALLDQKDVQIYAHALTETFNTITGGRIGFRVAPDTAAEVIEATIFPRVRVVSLTAAEWMVAIRDAQRRGVRGGAVFDYLHLATARKAKAERLYTLNISDFRAFHRSGDPQIIHP